jgi:hypothetical protein
VEEIITTTIDREAILAILAALVPSLRAGWGPQVIGSHGGVSRIHIDQQWQPQAFPVETLIEHLIGEESRVEFRVSQWDYWLHDPSGAETIQLCHESDLHFDLPEGTLRSRAIEILTATGIAYYSPR